MIENHVRHLAAQGGPDPAGLADARMPPRPLARPPAPARARDLEKSPQTPPPRGVPQHTHGGLNIRNRAGVGGRIDWRGPRGLGATGRRAGA